MIGKSNPIDNLSYQIPRCGDPWVTLVERVVSIETHEKRDIWDRVNESDHERERGAPAN